MKSLYVLFFAVTLSLAINAQTVNVTGYAFYDNKTTHDSIKVVFERTAPGVYKDSTYTNSSGYYSRTILPGIYNVHFKRSFYRTDTVVAINLFTSKNIDTALMENYQLIGNLKGTINAGTYRVGGDIFVTKNDTLIIKPGVRLLFMPDFQFKVEGLLLANGNITDSIIFTSYKITTKWRGIFIDTRLCQAYKTNYSNNKLILSYCLIERSKNIGLTIYGQLHGYNQDGTRFSISDIVVRDCDNEGMYFDCNDTSSVQNAVIYNNKNRGIYLRSNIINFKNLVVTNNSAVSPYYLCGIYILGVRQSNFENATISNNKGYGILCHSGANINLINCKIYGNEGGIAFGYPTTITITNSIITDNNGFGIVSNGYINRNNKIIIYNSTIAGNKTNNYTCGGICLIQYSYLNCSNSIIANNNGFAIFIDTSYSYRFSSTNTVEISNSLIANNTFGKININSHPWLFKKIITNSNGDSCDAYYNIFIDPKFVNAVSGDYHLTTTSPCIDEGVNDSVSVYTDLDGNVRIWDGDKDGVSKVDMGCYEFGSAIIYDLGKDASICSGDSIILDAGPGFSSYNWNNGMSTNQKIIVKTAGRYRVTVKNSYGNEGTDSINVSVNQNPVKFSIGNDSDICSDDTLILIAKNGFSNYVWNDNTTQHQKSITKTGNYFVTVTDSNGCSVNSDTVKITVHSLPVVKLGNDTTFCNGNFKLIDAGQNFIKYIWNTKETTQAIQATKPGDYYVKVTDSNSCEAFSDTLTITVNQLPKVKLRSDTAFCANIQIPLKAGNVFTTYKWNTNETQSTIFINKTGDYFVFITDSNGCSNYSDTVSLIVYNLPNVKLGNDTGYCTGNSVVLNAGTGYTTYLWSNNGSVNNLLNVNKAGNYFVKVRDVHGCENYSDTVNVIEYQLPKVNLGNDTSICIGDYIEFDAGSGYNTYNWSDGITHSRTLTTNKAGNYSVNVIDNHGCAGKSDTVKLTINSLPIVSLGNDTSIYDNQYLTLNAGSGFSAYKWQNNSADSFFTVNGPALGTGTFTFYVTVTDANNCSSTDSIIITIKKFIGISLNEDIDFDVYPNPSENHIFVNCMTSGRLLIVLSDLNGKTIKEMEILPPASEQDIDISECKPGVYILKIIGEGKIGLRKVIKL